MTSIIRYKYKTDREFEFVQFEGANCALGELKRLILEKSFKSRTNYTKCDFDLIIYDSNSQQEYNNPSQIIPCNTSVIVVRRMRERFQALPNDLPDEDRDLSSNIVEKRSSQTSENGLLRRMHHEQHQTNERCQSVDVSNTISVNLTEASDDHSETELIQNVIKSSQRQYPSTNRTKQPTCHNCDQIGHLRHQCPLFNSNFNAKSAKNLMTNGSDTSERKEVSKPSASTRKSNQNGSYIITNKAPYQMSHHRSHSNHHRPHHRNSIPMRSEPSAKKLTGIPLNSIIPIPSYTPGAMVDSTGNYFVSRPMAEHLIEQNRKKNEVSGQVRARSPSVDRLTDTGRISNVDSKSTNIETTPTDLQCPLCKNIFVDAVVTPCCHKGFCDECIRNALIQSDEFQCPLCQKTNVEVDQLNPSTPLRFQVDRWREEQMRKSSYIYEDSNYDLQNLSKRPFSPENLEQSTSESLSTSVNQSSTDSSTAIKPKDQSHLIQPRTEDQQQKMKHFSTKPNPIVIRMQPTSTQSSSPSANVQSNKVDSDSDVERTSENDQSTTNATTIDHDDSSQVETIFDDNGLSIKTGSSSSTNQNQENLVNEQTPPSQVAPVSAISTSPTLNHPQSSSTTSALPNYYADIDHIPPHIHGVSYSQQLPSMASNSIYAFQQPFYPAPLHMSYPSASPSIAAPILPMNMQGPTPNLLHSYTNPSMYSQHPMMHSSSNPTPLNTYHPMHYNSVNPGGLPYPGSVYPIPPGSSSFIPTHQVPAQTLPNPIVVPLSEEQFYLNQKVLRQKRSSSKRRSPSRSLSRSSRSSSISSHSHRHDRHRSSRSDSSKRPTSHYRREEIRTRANHNKSKEASEDHRKSPTIRDRRHSHQARDRHSPEPSKISSKTRHKVSEGERKRSPRPPPTPQQSMQRTMVYSNETKSRSANTSRSSEVRSQLAKVSKDPLKTSDKRTETPIENQAEKPRHPQISVSLASLSRKQETIKLSSKIESVSSSQRRERSISTDRSTSHSSRQKKHRHDTNDFDAKCRNRPIDEQC